MRVIAGVARGCGLTAPKGTDTRPTTDRLKENLFNLLSPYVKGSCFLDLYCGSGAIGIEALSRGAAKAVMVESSPDTVRIARENLQKTKLDKQAHVLLMTTERALPLLTREGDAFDIIFMDPPYEGPEAQKTLLLLEQFPLLKENGMLVIELSSRSNPPESLAFDLLRSKMYGNTQFAFYSKLN